MSVIYILIAFSLLVAVGFLAAFLWAVRSGQYDDTHTPSMRMLFDDRGQKNVSRGGAATAAERVDKNSSSP